MKKKRKTAQQHRGPQAVSGDEAEYAKIATMNERQLLDYVLGTPELLTDKYYRGYDTAIYARHEELVKLRGET